MGEGKKIVVEHVRVEDLPLKLREGLETGKLVRVTVEEESSVHPPFSSVSALVGVGRGLFGSSGDVDQHIREMRDQWDE
jgi:hypothetical protein